MSNWERGLQRIAIITSIGSGLILAFWMLLSSGEDDPYFIVKAGLFFFLFGVISVGFLYYLILFVWYYINHPLRKNG